MSSDFPNNDSYDPKESLNASSSDNTPENNTPTIQDTVSEVLQETEISQPTFSRDAYLYAFLQNITPGSPYNRDPEKIYPPLQKRGRLSKDEERLFEDLDKSPVAPPSAQSTQKHFIPLGDTPGEITNVPIKKGFFGGLKSTIKNAAKAAGNILHTYWKGAAAIGAAGAMGVSTQSENKKLDIQQTLSHAEPISSITQDTPPAITPLSLENISPDAPIATINTLPQQKVITPLEHTFWHQEEQIPTDVSLIETVLPGTYHDTQEPGERKIALDNPISIEENTLQKDITPIPFYVISRDKGKTVYITDLDGDKTLSGDEVRRAYFKTVGGNLKKNTRSMYTMADNMGLQTNIFTEKKLEYSDIISGNPVTKTLTIDGLIYTISANTDAALKMGEEMLIPSSRNTIVENMSETVSAAQDTKIPRAIIVPEAESEIPRALPIFEESSSSQMKEDEVLPPKSSGVILPMFSHKEIDITQRAMSYKNTREYVLGNGKYEGNSHMILPTDTETGRAIVESWLGTLDAIREVSTDRRQQQMTLQDFYTRHVRIVDKNGKHTPMFLATFLRKYADFTDIQIARALGKTLPENVVDNNSHDGEIPQLVGTWDTNGWVEAKDLIEQGAKRLYGDFPTIEEYNEYFRNNVSLDKHPEIKTWFDFLKHVAQETRKNPIK